MGLLLQAVDVQDRWRWRWLLTDEASGVAMADHQVSIDPKDGDAEAFIDLYRYLRWHAEPDRRVPSETNIVDRVGRWAGTNVLGASVGAAIAAAAPTTVRVQVSDRLGWLLAAPLELAHVEGRPLARHGEVSLVYDLTPAGQTGPALAFGGAAVDNRLRMVAVFSQPTETSVLGLRRERYELTRLVRGLAARAGRVIELEVLQYGVTRELLRDRMAHEGGPDVLHLSGHGGAPLMKL